MEIVEFLRARLDEDEAVARAAIGRAVWCDNTGVWEEAEVRDAYGAVPLVFAVAKDGARTQVASMEAAHDKAERQAHITRHDPARVLREVEAKRDIVTTAVYWLDHGYGDEAKVQATQTLESLAAVYADHPDAPDYLRT